METARAAGDHSAAAQQQVKDFAANFLTTSWSRLKAFLQIADHATAGDCAFQPCQPV